MARPDFFTRPLSYLQSILDCTRDALFVTEAHPNGGGGHRICFLNDAFTQLTGYTLADAAGMPPTILCGPDTDFLMVEKLEAAFDSTEKSSLVLLSYRTDGSCFKNEFFVTPLNIDGGKYVIATQRQVVETATVTATSKCLEEQFQSLTDNLSEAILIHHNKQPLFINAAYINLFGYSSRTEALREISPLMNLPLNQAAEGRTTRCEVLRTDGLPLRITLRSSPIVWHGKHATFLTINRDPRNTRPPGKQANAGRTAPAVRPDEAMLMRELLDSLPVILAHKTRDLQYTYVNKTYADWVMQPREQIIGHHVSSVRNEAHYQLMKKRRENVFAGRVVQYNTKCEFPGRGICDLLTTLIPRRDADGAVNGYFSMAQDITALKEIERALTRREEQLRLVMDSVPALISYRDRNLRYHYVNQPYSDWCGVRREDMIGRHMTDFIELSVFRDLKPYLDRVLAGERIRHTYRFDLRDRNKKRMTIDFVPHQDRNGHIAGFFALGQEIPTTISQAPKSDTELNCLAIAASIDSQSGRK